METYAVVVAGLVINLIVAGPNDKYPGATLVPVRGQHVTMMYKWDATKGFIPPDKYAVVFGRRVEQVLRVRAGDPTPSIPQGATLVKMRPSDVVSEFRTTYNPGIGFQTVTPDKPDVAR